jgi:hypothetical protein
MLAGVAFSASGAAQGRRHDRRLANHTLSGNALLMEIGALLLIGVGIYFLRVGWRQILYGAAYQLGVSLRTASTPA